MQGVELWGYDGSNWQTLLVESSALKNLRVKLYDGANGIDSDVADGGTIATTFRGLGSMAILYAFNGSTNSPLKVYSATYPHLRVSIYDHLGPVNTRPATLDNEEGSYRGLVVNARLLGFDGAFWDRLRTYGTGILKVGRAEVGLSTPRKETTGSIKASAGKLYWVTFLASGGVGQVTLSDDTDGSTAVVFAVQALDNDMKHVVLDPPMEFANGIYLKSVVNPGYIIWGYL